MCLLDPSGSEWDETTDLTPADVRRMATASPQPQAGTAKSPVDAPSARQGRPATVREGEPVKASAQSRPSTAGPVSAGPASAEPAKPIAGKGDDNDTNEEDITQGDKDECP